MIAAICRLIAMDLDHLSHADQQASVFRTHGNLTRELTGTPCRNTGILESAKYVLQFLQSTNERIE